MRSTPYGKRWDSLTEDDIISVNQLGEVTEGKWDVTPAVFIHTELYKAREDARVIIHNHPHYGSLLSTIHQLPLIAEQQACMFDAEMAFVKEYTGAHDTPLSGQQLTDSIGNATAIVLANHGVLIIGATIEQATYRALTFERTCRLHYEALSSGIPAVPVPIATRRMLKRYCCCCCCCSW